MKKYIPQQQHFEKFTDLIDAATTQYTLSFKDACKALKCSRSWAQKHIRPHVANIYLANGKGTNKINYARLVSLAVNQKNGKSCYSNESIYLDENAFNQFIINSIVTCQKRSKKVYRTYFIDDNYIENYYKELLMLYNSYSDYKLNKKVSKEELWYQINTCYLKYAKNNYVKEIIHPAIVHHTKRTEAPFIDVPFPNNIPIMEWKAVHDLMDYGDIEETIYRGLFDDGCIRIELNLPDKDGEIKQSRKIYYISDPDPIHQNVPDKLIINKILQSYAESEESEDRLYSLIYNDKINIKQSAWFEYNRMLGNNITY